MQKRNALLRLRKTLLARWKDLHEKLADELANLCDFKAADHTGDSADVAFETSSDEMSSQLAELDAHELSQIERALARMKQGAYGVCENCERKITLARLNALPYATLCINCERQMEKFPGWQSRPGKGKWDQVIDSDSPTGNHGIKLSEMATGLSSIN
jgi:DnaK suppressor protein